jgi:hypothetical protein
MQKEDGASKRKSVKRQKEKEKSGRGQKHGKKNGVLAGGLWVFLPCAEATAGTAQRLRQLQASKSEVIRLSD